jgi:hypothetical protein
MSIAINDTDFDFRNCNMVIPFLYDNQTFNNSGGEMKCGKIVKQK